jgi:hypothetical protein
MPVFPSSEWIDAFCVELSAHPRAAAAASKLAGVYRFVVDPREPIRERHTYEVLLAVDDGQALARQVSGTASPRLTVQTDYGRWRQLLEGRLDLGPAILFGQLSVRGDIAALVRSSGDANVVVDALRGVDTLWAHGAQ